MMKRAEATRMAWLKREGICSAPMAHAQLEIGTDCSGVDAPIFAVRELQVKMRHKFSCDCAEHSRRWIEACCPPEGEIFQNMLQRDHSQLPNISAYFCGWPCKPFSLLRVKSKFWRDPNARPFEAGCWLICILFCAASSASLL